MNELKKKLLEIQKNLKVPKAQKNAFGNYNYRSCEDILESVKPLLNGVILTLTDDIISVSDRVYVKATATLTDGADTITTSAMAREPIAKKGMDESQITGAASSYARKYALNGLFCIDDTRDADTMDNKQEPAKNNPDSNGLLKKIKNVDKSKMTKEQIDYIATLNENTEHSVLHNVAKKMGVL